MDKQIIVAGASSLERETSASVALDGDTRRSCNDPNCSNDWPCTIHTTSDELLKEFISCADEQHELLKKSFKYLSKEGPTRRNANRLTQRYRDTRFRFLNFGREGKPTL